MTVRVGKVTPPRLNLTEKDCTLKKKRNKKKKKAGTSDSLSASGCHTATGCQLCHRDSGTASGSSASGRNKKKLIDMLRIVMQRHLFWRFQVLAHA